MAVIGVVLLLLVGSLAGAWYYLKVSASSSATDIETGCLSERPTPEAVLVLVDETDKLSRENAERIRTHIADSVRTLPRYSRIIVVPFGGDLVTPLRPIFDRCIPGRGGDAGVTEGSAILDRHFAEFENALDGLVNTLTEIPDSAQSPITQQVVRAASDEVLHWTGETRRLYLVTDGLESSVYWTRDLHLQPAPAGILAGVKVEYFEIGNARNSSRQTRDLREEWREWLTQAGADVRMHAPGYPAS
jgi:hypothetical protein